MISHISLAPKDTHDIRACCAAQRNVRGERRCADEHRTSNGEAQRVKGLDFEEHPPEGARGNYRATQADEDADAGEPARFPRDHPANGSCRGAERHADGDLPIPLAHVSGHDGIQADSREQERREPEDTEQKGVESRPGQGARKQVRKRRDAHELHIRVDRREAVARE